MRSFPAVLCLSVLLVGVLQTTPAKAETEEGAVMTPRGSLYCEGNRVLIYLGRESLANVMSALPPGTQGFTTDAVDSNECTLADGRKIRAKIAKAEPFPGQCGSGTEVFLSLWIDRKKVFSRSTLYADCWMNFNNIRLIDGDQVLACMSPGMLSAVREDYGPFEGDGCLDMSKALTDATFDLEEYASADQDLPLGKVRVSFAEDPVFCARFLSKEPPTNIPYDEVLAAANNLGPISDPRVFQPYASDILVERDYIHAIPEMDDQPIFTQLAQQLDHATWRAIGKLDTNLYMAGYDLENPDPIDFDNDGTDDVVLRHVYRASSAYGDRFYVLPMDEGVAALDLLGAKATAYIGVPGVPANANEGRESYNATAEMTRIFRGNEEPADDYRLQIVFRYQGQTLVFATMFNGYEGALLYRPRLGGVEEPVCIFERRPDNW